MLSNRQNRSKSEENIMQNACETIIGMMQFMANARRFFRVRCSAKA